jgi:type 1 fimbria pilin
MMPATMVANALRTLAAAGLLLGVSLEASATCDSPDPGNPIVSPLPVSISVRRDTQVGTVLYSSVEVVNTTNLSNCTPDTYIVGQLVTPSLTPTAMANTFATNVPGIGIQFINGDGEAIPPLGTVKAYGGPYRDNAPILMYFGIRLVVTGPVEPGTLSLHRELASIWLSDSSTTVANGQLLKVISVMGDSQVISQGCTLDMPTAVTLPVVAVGSFDHSTAGATFFNLSATCNAGIRVSYQIDGLSEYAPLDGVLNNTAATGMATGVGIQLLDGTGSNPPVVLADKNPVTTTATNGQRVNIPLIARYYKTGPTVTPGHVQAVATVTMYYE